MEVNYHEDKNIRVLVFHAWWNPKNPQKTEKTFT